MAISDELRIIHMRDACRRIVALTVGLRREDLDDDELRALGLVKLVETIGEASNNVSQAKRSLHPGIQWRAIANMRHVLVHNYSQIDVDTLWETLTVDVPGLSPELESITDETNA